MNGQPSHEELRERDASFDACFHRVEVPRQFCDQHFRQVTPRQPCLGQIGAL